MWVLKGLKWPILCLYGIADSQKKTQGMSPKTDPWTNSNRRTHWCLGATFGAKLGSWGELVHVRALRKGLGLLSTESVEL